MSNSSRSLSIPTNPLRGRVLKIISLIRLRPFDTSTTEGRANERMRRVIWTAVISAIGYCINTLAVIPAALASVLLLVGGIGIWSDLNQMIANLAASGVEHREILGQIIFILGPTLLFPVWGVALAVATLGYYYRRRGLCRVCGASRETSSGYQKR